MAGTDVYSYKSTDYSLDQTYYGNGCGSGEYPEGEESSKVSCSSRFSDTLDGETQVIGAYYTFNSAASGSGGYSVATLNSNTPDTFCPLGWQLPYSGTGGDYYDQSRSWRYLFTQYSINSDRAGATKVVSYPLSYIWSGTYYWGEGVLKYKNATGLYWSRTVQSGASAFKIHAWSSGFDYAAMPAKNAGGALRCVDYFSIHPSTARWKDDQMISGCISTQM